MAEVAYIALGSNLGDRDAHLAFARGAIASLPRTHILDATLPEETEPFGAPGQRTYLNQMIAIETDMEPHELLTALQAIEAQAGRTRDVRWGPRTLDLDIVRFGDRSMADDRLVIPHPGLPTREFWQRELRQLSEGPR